MTNRLSSSLILSRGGGRVGADRIALIEAIAAEGSISEAARKVGLSYRGAWDAVQAVNNLFDSPLVAAKTGGAKGGVAEVTKRGKRLVAAYRKIETELAQAWARIDQGGLDDDLADLRSLGMRTSARNALRGVVSSITDGAVNAEVVLDIGGVEITAIITRSAVEDLGLAIGAPAIALIKSTFVILAPAQPALKTSARNTLIGTVVERINGAVNAEFILELAGGKRLTAVVTMESAAELGLKVGDKAQALIKAPHVILAVD